MKRSTGWMAVAACCAVLLGAPLPAGSQATGRVTTVTRLVKLFLDKEASLASAIRNADAQALGRLLAEDFELRTGARAANPVPRASWMAESLRTRDAGGDIADMAVHDFGPVAIASFTQDASAGRIFVVDVWRREAAEWKLQVRYANPAGTADRGIPGAGAAEPGIPKKY